MQTSQTIRSILGEAGEAPAATPQQQQQVDPNAARKQASAPVTWGSLAQTLSSQQSKDIAKKIAGGALKVGMSFLPGAISNVADIAKAAVPFFFQRDKARDPRLVSLDMDDSYDIIHKELATAFVKYIAPFIQKNAQDPKLANAPIPPHWINDAMKKWLASGPMGAPKGVELRRQQQPTT